MTPAADPPAVVVTLPVAPRPDVVVVSRDTRSEVLVSRDTPLPLVKAGRTEDALLRQAIFLTSTLIVVRPAAAGPGGGDDRLRWTYEPYVQRQLCFTSMTGQFSCAAAEVAELTEKAAGETPLAATAAASGPNLAAEGARIAVAAALRTRATALFEDDRRLWLSPMLKSAGVAIRPARPTPARR